MRMLLCSAVFPPAWQFGGMAVWAAQAAGELAARGHEVTVFASDVGAKDAPTWEMLPDGIAVVRSPGRMIAGLLWSRENVRAAKRAATSMDLVVVSGFWQWPVASVCKAARAAGAPVVLVPHGGLAPWVLARRAPLKRGFFKLHAGEAVRCASAIHFVSDLEAGAAAGLDGTARKLVSVPGVDFDFWSPDDNEREVARAGAGVRAGKAMFVWTGRFNPVKGLDLLPEALTPLRSRDWELVLVGHDRHSPVAQALERAFADAGLAGKVVFVGGSDPESVRTLLRSADGFVMPSRHESFGFAAAEAAACGCAVAVSDACGIADIGAGEGFAVLPREPAAWTAWFRSVIDAVAGGARPGGCRERLAPVLTKKSSWDRTEALYREVATAR